MNTGSAAGVGPPMRGRAAAVLLVLAVQLLLAPGCGRAEVPISTSAPGAEEILGRSADLRIVMRPLAIVHDPFWGPRARRMLAHPPDTGPGDLDDKSFACLFHASELDISVVFKNPERSASLSASALGADSLGYLIVVHGMGDFDPVELESEKGEHLYSEPQTLSSGARLLRPGRPPKAGRIDGPLFVFPGGTWVGIGGRTERHARSVLVDRSKPPGPSGLDSRILFAAFVDSSLAEQAWEKDYVAQTVSEHLTGAGLVLYGGKGGALDVLLDYDSSAGAEHSAAALRRDVEKTCDKHAVGCRLFKTLVGDVALSTHDRRATVRLTPSEKLIELLAK